MVIWQSVPVLIRDKVIHCKKIGGKLFKSFITDYGEVPIARYNMQTKKWEEVENNRGKAYAARRRQKYRRRKNGK